MKTISLNSMLIAIILVAISGILKAQGAGLGEGRIIGLGSPHDKGKIRDVAPETPAALDVEAVSALLEELQAGLSEFIDAEDDIANINEKWQAREDLTDQTKKRILELLFEDVESVIADEEIRKAIWDKWNSDEVQPD
ncbi:MAG: hypothetical protein WAT37_07260 [Saprospiraceae bacterium]